MLYTVVLFKVCGRMLQRHTQRIHWAAAACYVIHCALLLCATLLVKLCFEKSFYLQDFTAFDTTICTEVVNFETTAQLVYCSFSI